MTLFNACFNCGELGSSLNNINNFKIHECLNPILILKYTIRKI